jgi:serine protease Do
MRRLILYCGQFLALVALIALIILPACTSPTPTSATPAPSPINPSWTPPTENTTALPPDLSTIVAIVRPSVVAINVQITSYDIFNRAVTQEGAGSGWIIDPNGLIVTNNHVVQGAQDIKVTLNDGRVFSAQNVAADPISDLAVVQIDVSGLPAVTIGDSSKLSVGMMVASIGNALGEGISMTAGWVSRLGVSITTSSPSATLYDLIQTSTPINPGDSGGPLVDTLGEVVGITNAKLVESGVENIGYAISIKTALPIIEQLIKTGYIVRPYFGVALQTVNAGIAAIYNLAVDSGVLVTNVDSNSPASSAGLQAGDVIVSINGITVTTSSQLADDMNNTQIGQKVKITYWRGNSQNTVEVVPTQNPTP